MWRIERPSSYLPNTIQAILAVLVYPAGELLEQVAFLLIRALYYTVGS